MTFSVTMPALGESVTEGTVTRWLKNVGDSVNVDEALLEVSTDKVDTEIPSPVTGVILSIEVPVDSTVPVGARLATIGSANGAVASTPAPTPAAPVVNTPAPVATPAPVQTAPVAPVPLSGFPVLYLTLHWLFEFSLPAVISLYFLPRIF